MRKYISSILIVVFLFDIGGYYLELCLWHSKVRNEISRKINTGFKDEDLTLIILPLSKNQDVRWTKPNKEFNYHGEMYDVVRMNIHDQKVFYYCIKDTREKQLIASYTRHNNRKKDAWKKLRIFSPCFTPPLLSVSDPVYPSDYNTVIINLFYQSHILGILSPPPKSFENS